MQLGKLIAIPRPHIAVFKDLLIRGGEGKVNDKKREGFHLPNNFGVAPPPHGCEVGFMIAMSYSSMI